MKSQSKWIDVKVLYIYSQISMKNVSHIFGLLLLLSMAHADEAKVQPVKADVKKELTPAEKEKAAKIAKYEKMSFLELLEIKEPLDKELFREDIGFEKGNKILDELDIIGPIFSRKLKENEKNISPETRALLAGKTPEERQEILKELENNIAKITEETREINENIVKLTEEAIGAKKLARETAALAESMRKNKSATTEKELTPAKAEEIVQFETTYTKMSTEKLGKLTLQETEKIPAKDLGTMSVVMLQAIMAPLDARLETEITSNEEERIFDQLDRIQAIFNKKRVLINAEHKKAVEREAHALINEERSEETSVYLKKLKAEVIQKVKENKEKN